jgi:hypothetical protein
MLLYGRRTWLAHGEVFALIFALLGRFAPLEARTAAGHSQAAARDLSGAARHAAFAAGQAAAVAHVAGHELGAAAYAILTSSPSRTSVSQNTIAASGYV